MNKKELTALRGKGWTYEEIAKHYGVTRQRIHQKLTGYKSKGSIEYQKGKSQYAHNYYKRNYRLIRESRERTKSLVLTHYGNGKCACVICGFDDIRALSIDHINNDGAEHRKKIGCDICRWLVKSNFPKGYQTLCMNCQLIKRAEKWQSKIKCENIPKGY